MISRKTIASSLGAVIAVATMASAVPMAAFAQSAPPPPQPYYDQCQRDNSNRGLTGAAVGGLAGGVIGNQASARGRHTENTLLGVVIGAVGGALIGRGDTTCPPPGYAQGYGPANYAPPPPPPGQGNYPPPQGNYPPPPPQGAYDQGYGYQQGYAPNYAPPPYYAEPAYGPPVYVEPPPIVIAPGGYYGRRHRYYY